MACERWTEHLIDRLCGDDPGDLERSRLDEHLLGCVMCRRTLDEMSAARSLLREVDGSIAIAPRVSVASLHAPRPRRPGPLLFAAGFGSAVLLLAVGLASGWWIAVRTGAGGTSSGPSAGAGAVTLAATDREALRREFAVQLEQQRRSLDRRLESQWQSVEALLRDAPRTHGLTRQDVESVLAGLEHRVAARRSSDVNYLLEQIAAAELRTGKSIGETQRALQYVALANNPSASLH